jgi:hypothetical protein
MSWDFHSPPISQQVNSPYDGLVARIPRAAARPNQDQSAVRRQQSYASKTMNKPSERIVVFVTPAQKRAIAASAEELGISVSELMRRAVLSFSATSEQVKAASIVDRLRAPREPDALNAALERVASGTRNAEAALPAVLKKGPAASKAAAQPAAPSTEPAPPPLLPADVLAALVRTPEEELAAVEAEAVRRMAAAEAAASALRADNGRHTARQEPAEPSILPVLRRRVRAEKKREEDDPRNDPAPEDGRFA